jgi:hypothetical protein
MKQGTTLLLKLTLAIMALAVMAVCILLLPQGIMDDKVGYYRPILIGLYIPTIPFLIALYQAYKLLNLIDANQAFSLLSVKALTNIKYCAVTISVMFALGMPYIYSAGERDDAPGVVLIGLIIISASFVVATFAAVLQKLMQTGLDIKSENDLTV